MAFGRKIREVPPLNSLDNIVLKCASPTKHPRQSGFVLRKATKSSQITRASNVESRITDELASVIGTESHTPT
jgi:hypothetical protein